MQVTSKDRQWKGPFWMALAALLFSFGGVLVKIIPWHPFSINCIRSFLAALIIGLFLKCSGHKLTINFPVFCGAVCVSLTSIFFTLATRLTAAANAIIIQYSCPIFVILLSFLIFRKRPQKYDIAAVIAVFCGILWFFIGDIGKGNFTGNMLALCAAVVCGGNYMMNMSRRADPLSSIFIGIVISIFIGFPFLFQETVFTSTVLAPLIFMGIVQYGAAYVIFYYGIRSCQSLTASLIGCLEPVLNPVWVALLYGEVIGLESLPGALLVLGTVILYIMMQMHFEKMTGLNRKSEKAGNIKSVTEPPVK